VKANLKGSFTCGKFSAVFAEKTLATAAEFNLGLVPGAGPSNQGNCGNYRWRFRR
jgi:hypothetical protein